MKTLLLFCALTLLISVPSLAQALAGFELVKTGGYEPVKVSKEEVKKAATFAVEAQLKVLKKNKEEGAESLELVEIVEAEQQVVAGINYKLTLKVKINGKERKVEAVVWWQAWRKPDPYQLTSWEWE